MPKLHISREDAELLAAGLEAADMHWPQFKLEHGVELIVKHIEEEL